MLLELAEYLAKRDLGFLNVMFQLQFRALAAAGLSFAIVLLLGPRVIRWLVRQKIGDSGATDAEALRGHNQSKANTPTMGGILIVGSILASIALLGDLSVSYLRYGVVVIVWLAVLGGMDDWLKLTAKTRGSGSRQGLYAWEKLIFQLGLGVIISWFVYNQGVVQGAEHADDVRHVLNLPFQRTYDPVTRELNDSLVFLSLPVFIVIGTLVIAGMSNAVNITDGMDGLAAGISIAVSIGAFVLATIAGKQGWAQSLLVPYVGNADELSVMCGATAGACLGFLWWNCSPARVFMGDTGALSLGGIIGYVAVVTRQELLILLMSGVFLAEIGSVMLQVGYFKATGGKRIFKVAPYHHHLHLSGWPEQQVVARMWIVSVILVVLALALIKVR
ncbi:MAG TPA: phospho-N-acetylmuramoyl-pentapeptide-transferase [Phycisphaerales bacterium]|nr:phospho-N-acetylmuramoyl-pentapeptide-transferase [Phycisphaerales bacterium]